MIHNYLNEAKFRSMVLNEALVIKILFYCSIITVKLEMWNKNKTLL